MTDEREMNDTGHDFGNDADVVPPSDPEFDAWLARMAPTVHAPTAVPRLEMWQAIQSATSAARAARGGPFSGMSSLRRKPWRLMSAIAAVLLLGVAIDRVTLRRSDRSTPPVVAGMARGDSSDPTRIYRMASAQTLTQAEALLTAYRASATSDRSSLDAPQLGRWGREVLSSTRLLIDSPAGDDPMLRALLNDLELVLVQVIQLSGGPLDPADRTLIDRALDDRDLLPRLRTAVPAGITGTASAD